MTRTRLLTAAPLIALTPLATAQVAFEQLAPPETAMFVSIADWPKMCESFQASSMKELIDEPSIRNFFKEVVGDQMESMEALLDDLDMTLEDLPQPEGSVGIAMYIVPLEDDGEEDEEEAFNPFARAIESEDGMIAYIDFGENADDAESHMADLLENREDEGVIEVEERKIAGFDASVVTFVKEEDDADDAEMDEFWAEEDEPFADEYIMIRVEDAMLIGTSEAHLTDALDRFDGARLPSLATQDAYKASRAQHPDDSDVFAAYIMTDPVRMVFDAGVQMALPIMLPGVSGLSDALGFTELQSVSIGLRMNTNEAMIEQTFGVLMPEKKGLFSLIDDGADGLTPPRFVADDTVSVSNLSVRFDRVFDVIQDLVSTLPDEFRGEAEAGIKGFAQIWKPVLETVGPEVYICQSIERPMGVDSSRQYAAIKAADPLRLANAIGPMMPMFGMEARDFQGNPIYEEPETGMGIGIGFDHLFIGSVDDIESAMRRASQPDMTSLADKDAFRQAVSNLADNGVVYGYTDLQPTYEYMHWQMQNMDKVIRAQMLEMGFNEAELDEMGGESFSPEWSEHLPNPEVINKYFGTTIFDLVPTEDGFRGTGMTFSPRNAG